MTKEKKTSRSGMTLTENGENITLGTEKFASSYASMEEVPCRLLESLKVEAESSVWFEGTDGKLSPKALPNTSRRMMPGFIDI